MVSQEFYDEYSRKGFVQVNSEKVNALALKCLKSPVLDLGCYWGHKTKWLKEHFDNAEGCDISSAALEKARETTQTQLSSNATLEKKDSKPKKNTTPFLPQK
ncbi:MAG: class I SAM-dependent methyltransferase [archaeon]